MIVRLIRSNIHLKVFNHFSFYSSIYSIKWIQFLFHWMAVKFIQFLLLFFAVCVLGLFIQQRVCSFPILIMFFPLSYWFSHFHFVIPFPFIFLSSNSFFSFPFCFYLDIYFLILKSIFPSFILFFSFPLCFSHFQIHIFNFHINFPHFQSHEQVVRLCINSQIAGLQVSKFHFYCKHFNILLSSSEYVCSVWWK